MQTTPEWLDEVAAAGRRADLVLDDWHRLGAGLPPLAVVRPCTLGDGIHPLPEALEAVGRQVAQTADAFVPASGAATRMFQAWRSALDDGERLPAASEVTRLAAWEGGATVAEGMERTMARWAQVPKGLVPFHRGGRTAVDEHLAESEALGLRRVHFTVGEGHQEAFLDRARGAAVSVSVSVQSPATDTLCFGADLQPLRDDEGQLMFRPSGHGALLGNLAAFGGRFVMIKNIDNVVAAPHRPQVLSWRWRLLGRAEQLRQQVWSVLAEGDAGAAQELLADAFGVVVPREAGLGWLRRPFRVAGMVVDEGAPGGGPYWVDDGQTVRPQVVEGAQLDPERPAHREALAAATHFHPVDLVVCLEGPEGPYDAAGWSDPEQSLIVHKRHHGAAVVALERPGLWNGGMAGYLTHFVEVPAAIFQPVKRIDDLRRRAHQG
jgi:hypothetical protein